jgi:DNA polymerase-3 subunit delta'
VGLPNVGKMTLAIDIAKAVNCLEEIERPCGVCQQCQRIGHGDHVDVQVVGVEMDHEAERLRAGITLPQIQEIEKIAFLKPYEGSHRVFIIDGAERLNLFAANALLKTLEEPPDGVLILLLTSDEENMPITLRSRCQRLELRPLTSDVVIKELVNKYSVADDRARLIARLSGGRLGWALSATMNSKIIEERADRIQQIYEVVSSGLEEKFEYSRVLSLQYRRDREAVRNVLITWLEWWRDMLVVRQGCQNLAVNIDYLGEKFEGRLGEMARRFQVSQIVHFINQVVDTLDRLEANANPQIALDMLMLELPRDITPVSKMT